MIYEAITGSFSTLGIEPVYLAYFVIRSYDYADPYEERRPWNDPIINELSEIEYSYIRN